MSARVPVLVLVSVLVSVVVSVSGCSESKSGSGSESGSGSGSESASPQLAVIEVDGRDIGGVTRKDVAHGPVVLKSLLPQALRDDTGWLQLDASGGRRRLQVPEPAKRYRGQEARLYLAPDGTLAMGLFQPGAAGATPTVELSGIDRVAIHTVAIEEEPPPPPISLQITVAGQPAVVLGDAELGTLKTAGGRDEQWLLLDVAGLGADAHRIERVTVVGDDGQKSAFDRAHLTAKTGAPILRRNRRGTLRLDTLGGPASGDHGGGGGGGEGTGSGAGDGDAPIDPSTPIRAATRLDIDLTPH